MCEPIGADYDYDDEQDGAGAGYHSDLGSFDEAGDHYDDFQSDVDADDYADAGADVGKATAAAVAVDASAAPDTIDALQVLTKLATVLDALQTQSSASAATSDAASTATAAAGGSIAMPATAALKRLAAVPAESIGVNMPNPKSNGFREVAVTLRIEASLEELQENKAKRVMALGPQNRAFDGAAAAKPGAARTSKHLQGRVRIAEVTSDFPVAVMLQASPALFGADAASVYSSQGVRGSFLVKPKQKTTFAAADLPVICDPIESDYTKEFLQTFPGWDPANIESDVQTVADPNQLAVKFNSPIIGMINRMREKANLPGVNDAEAHSVTMMQYLPKQEVEDAKKQVIDEIANNVHVTNLYDALRFTVARAFTSSDTRVKSESRMADESWTDSAELIGNSSRSRQTSADVLAKAKSEVHTMYVGLLVEYQSV